MATSVDMKIYMRLVLIMSHRWIISHLSHLGTHMNCVFAQFRIVANERWTLLLWLRAGRVSNGFLYVRCYYLGTLYCLFVCRKIKKNHLSFWIAHVGVIHICRARSFFFFFYFHIHSHWNTFAFIANCLALPL